MYLSWYEGGPGYVENSLIAYFCSSILPEKLSMKGDKNGYTLYFLPFSP
jgi:hypothetical protein